MASIPSMTGLSGMASGGMNMFPGASLPALQQMASSFGMPQMQSQQQGLFAAGDVPYNGEVEQLSNPYFLLESEEEKKKRRKRQQEAQGQYEALKPFTQLWK